MNDQIRIQDCIDALTDKYDNALAVFGGAYFANDIARNNDIATFCEFLPGVVRNAKFFKWYEGVAGALYRFCHMCLVDPTLIEAHLGIKFKEAFPNA